MGASGVTSARGPPARDAGVCRAAGPGGARPSLSFPGPGRRGCAGEGPARRPAAPGRSAGRRLGRDPLIRFSQYTALCLGRANRREQSGGRPPATPDPGVAPFVRPQWGRPAARPAANWGACHRPRAGSGACAGICARPGPRALAQAWTTDLARIPTLDSDLHGDPELDPYLGPLRRKTLGLNPRPRPSHPGLQTRTGALDPEPDLDADLRAVPPGPALAPDPSRTPDAGPRRAWS